MVVNNRVVYVDEKIPKDKNDATWDRPGKECTLKNVAWSDWRMGVVEAALKASSIAGLSFCVVDIITKDDNTYVLEVNTAPMLDYFKNKESYNQKVLSEALIHLIKEGSLEPVEQINTWKDVIHPTRWKKENAG
jgi:glutathione synthase/RimK-type ligase-like ATP-grasp enzyme